MSTIFPECPDADASNRSVAADLLFRQEPDDEEAEEEEDEDQDEDQDEEDDDEDEGYSE